MRALLLSIAFASVVRRAEQTAAESEVAVASDGAEGGPVGRDLPRGSRGYVTKADGTRVPFCSYRKSDQCETECGVASIAVEKALPWSSDKTVGLSSMELGPKRCARCEWVRSKKTSSPKPRALVEADPDSITCGPGGFSVEEVISWGVSQEKCCYADVCFAEAMPCVDEDEYRYGAYFGEESPGSSTNHGPNGYVPPTRHRAGGHVGVNNAWRHVDTQAGVDAARNPQPVYPMPPPTKPMVQFEARDLTPVNPRTCDLEKGLLDSCLQTKQAAQCRPYLELLRSCLA